MIKPISPNEINKTKYIPDEVIELFNELINRNFNGTEAVFDQDEIVELISIKLCITREKVFKDKLLDIESIYEKVGWIVKYSKPSYGESFNSFFRFIKK